MNPSDKPQNPDAPADTLKKIGSGLKNLLGGLMAAGSAPAAVTPNAARSFVLRYNNESVTVTEGDLPAGSTLPTVKAAFQQNAARLGIESGREQTYRVGETVADGDERVEWGNTYFCAVVRTTKGC